jgi:hypothetical protein
MDALLFWRKDMAQSKNPSKVKSVAKTRARKSVPRASTSPPAIPDEEIALRAYTLWEERGKPLGSPDEDWLKAMEQLQSGS